MREKNMKKALGSLINREISIFLDDNQSVEGVLLDVKQDYLAINIDEKIYYFILAHIQAFTKNAKVLHALPKKVDHLNSNDLIGVLTNLQNKWVTINHFSKQVFCGVLSSVQEDYIIVANDQELHYIATSLIANIHPGVFEDESKLTKDREKFHIEISSTTKTTEQYDEINEEKIIEGPILRLVAVMKKLVDSSEEEVQAYLPKEQVLLKHSEKNNNVELEENVQVAHSTTNEKNEEPIDQTEPPIRINEKRILLTPWSQMNYDQNAIAIPATNRKNSAQVIGLPSELNQTLIEEKLDHPKTSEPSKTEKINRLSALRASIERFEEQTTETFISPKERKAMLEKQYYALMRHAGQNSTNLEQYSSTSTPLHSSLIEKNLDNDQGTEESKKLLIHEKKDEKAVIEKQFYSLMRHAAKMYRQLRD